MPVACLICKEGGNAEFVDQEFANGEQPTIGLHVMCINVLSCRFDNCQTVNTPGGALCIQNNVTIRVIIHDSLFSECNATGGDDGRGGAVYLELARETGNGLQVERNTGSKCCAYFGGWFYVRAFNADAANAFHPRIACCGMVGCVGEQGGCGLIVYAHRSDTAEIYQAKFTECSSWLYGLDCGMCLWG
jgi:hypothetical protein